MALGSYAVYPNIANLTGPYSMGPAPNALPAGRRRSQDLGVGCAGKAGSPHRERPEIFWLFVVLSG